MRHSPLVTRIRVGKYEDKVRFVMDVVGTPEMEVQDRGGTVEVRLR